MKGSRRRSESTNDTMNDTMNRLKILPKIWVRAFSAFDPDKINKQKLSPMSRLEEDTAHRDKEKRAELIKCVPYL